MWETPFDESMLNSTSIEDCYIIIRCPYKHLADELMDILSRNHIKWAGSKSHSGHNDWERYREDTCYWINNQLIYVNNTAYAEFCYTQELIPEYITCTYLGRNQDFEPADDSEMQSFLGF